LNLKNMNDLIITGLPKDAAIAIYPPGATFGPRPMIDWEFVWMLEGDAEYSWNDTTVAAPEGSIVLCRPGGVDAFRWDPNRRTRHAFFHFDVLHWPASWPPAQNWPFVRMPGADDIMPVLFRHILALYGGDYHLQLQVAMTHFMLAFWSGETSFPETPGDAPPDPVSRALEFIHGRLETEPAQSITLPEIAQAACVSAEHLCRVMKNATGYSPLETVRLARLDRAATLLARSNFSVGEIANLCGFASAFHFSRRFKEAFELSPREVRRAVRSGQLPPLPRLLRRQSLLPPTRVADHTKKSSEYS
jgi:AraC family transcriptional regulator